jgi:hypothetical protein
VPHVVSPHVSFWVGTRLERLKPFDIFRRKESMAGKLQTLS